MQSIKELRELNGLSQRQVADALGVAPPTVQGWELKLHRPHPVMLKLLADYFDVDPTELDLAPNRIQRRYQRRQAQEAGRA